MREIKFRAWVDSGDGDKYMVCQGEPDVETLQSLIFMYGDNELMQYTGLKDKNGKEIYEGDILGDTDSPEEYYIWGKVAYCDTPDCIYAGMFMLQGSGGGATEWGDAEGEYWHRLEVIGNIYENPELLEV